MKSTLTFKLPEEQDEFQHALQGTTYSIILWEFDQYLRGKLKYEQLSDVEYKIYEDLRQKLWDLAKERDVSL